MSDASIDNCPSHARRVLVVDDNEPSALSLSWAMELYGYEVRTCFDGKSAVDVAHEFQPELVLLDIGMPIMNGYEVCEKLKSDPVLSRTRVIAQTGWGDRESRRRAEAAGFDHHLTKPIDINALLEIVAA